MKKIFLIILGFVAMTSLQAANTEVARITLSGDGGAESSYVTLRLDPTATEVTTTSYFGVMDEVGQVNIYVPYDNGQWSAYKANNLTNVALTVITNRRDASYTLTFNVPTSTDGLTLYDKATGTSTPIVHNGSYPFEVNTTLHPSYVAGTNYTIADRFYINYDATAFEASVTTNAYGWASFSYDADLTLTLPAGLKIYKGAIAGDVLNLSEMDYVAANEGVIVYGAPNTKYYFAAGSGSSDYSGNSLKPSSAWTSNTGNIYVLHDEALYQYTGSDMPANKAYLPLPGGASSAPKHIRMVIAGTTAVDNVEAESVKAEKFVEDGQVYIRRGNEVFNLQGQKVNF